MHGAYPLSAQGSLAGPASLARLVHSPVMSLWESGQKKAPDRPLS
jgi:hypothetical protein